MAPGLWASLWQLGGTGRGWRDTRIPKARSGEAGSLLELLECSAQGCTYTCVQTQKLNLSKLAREMEALGTGSSSVVAPWGLGPCWYPRGRCPALCALV